LFKQRKIVLLVTVSTDKGSEHVSQRIEFTNVSPPHCGGAVLASLREVGQNGETNSPRDLTIRSPSNRRPGFNSFPEL